MPPKPRSDILKDMGGGPLEADDRSFVIDTREFPIVRMIFPRFGNHESIDTNFENMLRVSAREPIIVIGDSRALDVETVTPKLRRHFFDKTNEFTERRGHHMMGEAALVANWVQKHFFQAYMWMKSNRAYPTRAFNDEAEAVAWCCEMIRAASAERAGYSRAPSFGDIKKGPR